MSDTWYVPELSGEYLVRQISASSGGCWRTLESVTGKGRSELEGLGYTVSEVTIKPIKKRRKKK